MKQLLATRAAVVGIASVGGLTLLTGISYAAWSASGTGSGTAKAGTLQAAVVSAGTAPSGQLYPGITANGTSTGGDLVVSASNPNPVPVTVTLTGGTFAGCTTTGVSLGATASFTLTANQAATQITIPKVLSMSSASSNDCQGATITVTGLTTSTVTQ